jgi:hypothetical protein
MNQRLKGQYTELMKERVFFFEQMLKVDKSLIKLPKERERRPTLIKLGIRKGYHNK